MPMITRISFKDYFPDCSSCEISVPAGTQFKKEGYIRFSSNDNQKRILHYYKDEMQQGLSPIGNNVGKYIIKKTGFLELYKRHSWTQFKDFVRKIVYHYEAQENRLMLDPLNMFSDTIPENDVILDI